MTTFDGATSTHETPPPAGPDAAGGGPASEVEKPFDAFEALREQVAERDEEDPDITYVEVPGIGWRLACRTDFEYGAYKNWQKAALPKAQRNGRKMNPLDMDQAVLAYLVLLNTCESVQYRRGQSDEWETLVDDDGAPSTLQSSTLLGRMNVMDPRLLIKRLFGKDGRLIAAGQQVISDAGYGDESGGAGEDPTG